MSLDQKSPPTQAPISCFCKHFVAPANKLALRLNTDVSACPQDGPKWPKISLQSNKSAGHTTYGYECLYIDFVVQHKICTECMKTYSFLKIYRFSKYLQDVRTVDKICRIHMKNNSFEASEG